MSVLIKRDTPAWIAQTWISFAASVLCAGYGVTSLPSAGLEGAFMALGFTFSTAASFFLSKTQRDNQHEQVDSSQWKLLVWIAFGLSIAVPAWGLLRLGIVNEQKAFLAVSWLFLTSSSFTLSKTLRDRYEADLIEHGGRALKQPD